MDYPFEVAIGGGGVAGLFAARELALNGVRCILFEDDLEIGIPEKCDGLVSRRALGEMNAPQSRTISNTVERAVLHSPTGIEIEIDARKQDVVVLDRAKFDQCMAAQVIESGCKLVLGSRVTTVENGGGEVKLRAGETDYKVPYFVDAMGCRSLISKGKSGVLQAGKYVVYGKWFESHTVELYFDQDLTPGFFTWLIPIDDETAKLGAAGYGINPFRVLDSFLERKAGGVMKKIASPISIGGSIERLTEGRISIVGDAAGQAKPTTAGGIYTGGLAGILAGRSIAKNLKEKTSSDYGIQWRRKFDKEFRAMILARKLMDNFDNKRLDEVFKLLKDSSITDEISLEGDFDFHSVALAKALGLKAVVRLLGLVGGAEFRNLLSLILE